MMAVDWLLFGERITTIIGDIVVIVIVLLVVLCGVLGAADEWRRRERARRIRVSEHPTSNVVRLVPRGRPFDWSADGDAS